MIYQEHAHRKLRQAFDAILQQFSSNDNRKSMLYANRSFQAQNSTCSTLLQIMLLYETCIVLSRKCLWDVNKDFWHQWRSLVINQLGPFIGKFRFHIYRPDIVYIKNNIEAISNEFADYLKIYTCNSVM